MAIGKRIKNNKGFTLVELIVVIALLGIIASVAIPRFTNVATDAKQKADQATATNIAKAAELAYYQEVENGDLEGSQIEIEKLKNLGYLDEIPEPQSKDGDFIVKVSGDGKITVGIDTDGDGSIDDSPLYGE